MFFFFDSENFDVTDLLDRIKSIKPLKDVIEQTGISQPSFSKWKARNSMPKADDLYKIACCLNVSMEYLLTGEDKQNELSQDETELLTNYRTLSDSEKSMLNIMIASLSASSQK